jgi:hypothetical protein
VGVLVLVVKIECKRSERGVSEESVSRQSSLCESMKWRGGVVKFDYSTHSLARSAHFDFTRDSTRFNEKIRLFNFTKIAYDMFPLASPS